MRMTGSGADWYEEYVLDIQIAREEIALNFPIDPKELIADIYCLPAHNHQTFLCRVICESGFMKLIYAKAVQNSVWFSEPIYMYRFEEAKKFADHPLKRGRIICGKRIIRKTAIDHLTQILNTVSDKQPDDLVTATLDCEFTAIRVYENGEMIREIMFTDAEKLVFREEEDTQNYITYMRDLHLIVERNIGIGNQH